MELSNSDPKPVEPPPPPPPNKQGILYKKSKSFWKSGWREKHFVLNGSSLYYYEKSTTEAAQGVIQLQNTKLLTETNDKRKFVIGLQHSEKLILLAAKNEVEYDEWLKALQAGSLLPPTPPPFRTPKKKAKVTSQLVDAVTNLPQVRKMLKDMLPEDTFTVMNSIKSFIAKVDFPEQADALELMALQLGAKVATLYKDKKVTREYLIPTIEPLHLVCDKLIDGYEIPFAFNASEVVAAINDLAVVLDKLLKPHLSDKAMKDFAALMGYLANEELLEDFFTKKKWKETQEVCMMLRGMWENGMV